MLGEESGAGGSVARPVILHGLGPAVDLFTLSDDSRVQVGGIRPEPEFHDTAEAYHLGLSCCYALFRCHGGDGTGVGHPLRRPGPLAVDASPSSPPTRDRAGTNLSPRRLVHPVLQIVVSIPSCAVFGRLPLP